MKTPLVSIVVACADNHVIGMNNQMPWHIPEDFKHFKTVTMGKPCIMGRKTFESILASLGKPLPGRLNIVISRNNTQYSGALTVKDIDEAIEQASKTDSNEICIVGGGQIYAQSLERNLVDRIYLTRVHQSPEGDAFFPALGTEWKETARNDQDGYSFLTFEKDL
jgi:dihydrofolate reductase